MTLSYDDALARLHKVHESIPGQQATARCPAHDDHKASLSIGLGDDGTLLVKCHAGCSGEAVLAALGGQAPDLDTSNGDQNGHGRRKKRPPGERHNPVTRRFQLYDASGHLCGVHGRVDFTNAQGEPDKELWWEEHDLATSDMPLYNLRALLNRPYQTRIYLTEGELKCDRLNQALRDAGLDALAVATVAGASGTPSDTVLAALVDYDVVLWPDNDDPGRGHMQRIAVWLVARGESPRWVHWPEAPAKGDVADFLKAGHHVAEIEALNGDVPMPKDATTSPESLGDRTGSSVASERVADVKDRSFRLLGAYGQNHAGEEASPEADAHHLLRRDTQGRFPLLSVADLGKLGAFRPEELLPGKIMKRSHNLLYGNGETGKSNYAQDACFGLAAAGVPIWYDAAEGFDGIYLRMLAWLATHPNKSLDALRVIPFPVQIFKGGDARILAAQARDKPEAERPAMIVLDTIHRCVLGARESDNGDMGCVANTAALWRMEFGGTTWGLHHEGKQAGQGMRGASCLFDDADSVQYVFRGGDISVIECERQKDAIPRFQPEAFTITMHSLDEWGYPGLRAGVLKSLDNGHIIEARRLWQADQVRRQPGAKNAVGDDDADKLSNTLESALKVFQELYEKHPDGVFKSTWREGCETVQISSGSFHWITQQLERRGKVQIPDTTDRYLPGK